MVGSTKRHNNTQKQPKARKRVTHVKILEPFVNLSRPFTLPFQVPGLDDGLGMTTIDSNVQVAHGAFLSEMTHMSHES